MNNDDKREAEVLKCPECGSTNLAFFGLDRILRCEDCGYTFHI